MISWATVEMSQKFDFAFDGIIAPQAMIMSMKLPGLFPRVTTLPQEADGDKLSNN
jgi:hypothetical protein